MSSVLPSNVLADADIELMQSAGQLIVKARDSKEEPAKLRLMLVEIQAMRFEIGRRKAEFKGFSRDKMSSKYRDYKVTMSNNAASKEAEMDPSVIEIKNSVDLLETAYEVMSDFVTTNQTSLRMATEEAKNTL